MQEAHTIVVRAKGLVLANRSLLSNKASPEQQGYRVFIRTFVYREDVVLNTASVLSQEYE